MAVLQGLVKKRKLSEEHNLFEDTFLGVL